MNRNTEYTEVLLTNNETAVYSNVNGEGLLEESNATQIQGLNNTIVATAKGMEVNTINYTDYGVSDKIEKGHAYNGELQEDTGLIYLRARYYDPEVGTFIQIDNKYAGEQEEVVTQNRYAYALNNPYKYVDPSGNSSLYGFPFNTWHNEIQRRYIIQYPFLTKEYYLVPKKQKDKKMYIDLFRVSTRQMWEIKPFGQMNQGLAQLSNYKFRYLQHTQTPAFNGGILNLYPQEFFYMGRKIKVYSYRNGIILYSNLPITGSKEPVKVKVKEPKKEKSNDWSFNIDWDAVGVVCLVVASGVVIYASGGTAAPAVVGAWGGAY